MAAAAVALSFVTVSLDTGRTGQWLHAQGWAYTGGADGASLVLSTVAGSMITIAGVVFSMTLVALSLASSQLGPRLLRGFMRDTSNQVVLGTFVATFLYCLMVLLTIRRQDEGGFVPHLSVSLGVLFALVSLGVLIYFIHHVSISVQADEVVAKLGEELERGIERLFPLTVAASPGSAPDPGEGAMPSDFDRDALAIASDEDGYLQLIDTDALMELATRKDVVLRLLHRPGRYIMAGQALAMAWPAAHINDRAQDTIKAAFVLGSQRTATQDIEHTVHQLVEIAVRALSPGVNDPFTAVTCVDRLGSALLRVASRQPPASYLADEHGRLRLATTAVTFSGVVDAAFDQIRQSARSTVSVTIRMLESIEVIASAARTQVAVDALRHQAEMLIRGARQAIPEQGDLRTVEHRYQVALAALSAAK